MKELLYVGLFLALVYAASAEVGTTCESHTDCSQGITEFCNRTRVCRWRYWQDWLPFFGCQPDGECALKRGFNETCHFDADCQTGHCRGHTQHISHDEHPHGWCVQCGNDTSCGAGQYCDGGFFRVQEPVKHMERRKEKSWWDWWDSEEDEYDDDAGEHYGEPHGRFDKHEQEEHDDDMHGRRLWERKSWHRNNRFGEKAAGMVDAEHGYWIKPIGAVWIKPTWMCRAKQGDGSLCLRDEQCTSNTCDGGRCVAVTNRQCAWDKMNHTSVGCTTNFHCSGGWDPLVNNLCIEYRNCTADAECPTGRFCDPDHKVCVQCNHNNYSVCGASNYCYWGMCRPRLATGYCDRWWMCLSGQCMAWNQQCAPVTSFSG